MTSWTDIHKGFGNKWYGKTYQQRWEEANITKEEAKEWIELGFTPNWKDLVKVEQWKNFNFSPAETKVWLKVGLYKDDWEFASWLRTNNHSPELVKNNLEQLRNDCENLKAKNPQLWLEQVYINHNIKKLNLSSKNLKGELNLRNYQQLESLNCYRNKLTNIILPTSLKELNLRNNNFPKQDLIDKYSLCPKCHQPNTSQNWCQPCAEQEWKQLSGQELINKFIEQQGKDRGEEGKLKWIPYEEFTDIKYLAEGGFSKVYKARWNSVEEWRSKVVLKSLNNSQNITLEFLTEIANTKLVDSGRVVNCHGISQDPTTKNYIMVMEYMKDGNLREYLQNKNNKFSLKDKLNKLESIAWGLNKIHGQNLVHQDFHSGNILNQWGSSYITDLGLSRPTNHLKEKGKIFGVLPYVDPEVLRGQPYTQKADIYSFGIIAYELLANSYPYPEIDNTELTLKVCRGLRPNIDKVPLPPLLKDLIKRCWDGNLDNRPETLELRETILGWVDYKGIIIKNTPFYQQYKEIEAEYNTFSQNTPYQIHDNAITTSKMIDTKTITQQLATYSLSTQMDFLNLKDEKEEQIQTNIEIPPK